ncbi:MAG TPA: hypothetical protein PLS95_10955 [Thermoanaerobaculales bacterium]|nr:hypothetical protein [Thermoanaerobaculales bacterium]
MVASAVSPLPESTDPGPARQCRGRYRAVLHVHTDRSGQWSYPPLGRFIIPDCFVPFLDRARQCAAAGIDLLAITDHDVPFVMSELDRRGLERLLSNRRRRLEVVSGEEVTVGDASPAGGRATAGAHVLVLYRGLDPCRDRDRILRAHRELHRHTHDAVELFRFLRTRDDIVDILAHPFAGPRRLGGETLHRLLSEGLIQRVEAFNGGEVTRGQNRYAAAVAEVYRLGVSSSDDLHRRWGRLRNHTWSAAASREEFLDDLVAGRTGGTTVHSPTYLCKYLELMEGFYLGYLPWLARSVPELARRRGPRSLLWQLAWSGFAAAVWAPASLAGMVRYLSRGSRRSRADFADLARLEPRLSRALARTSRAGLRPRAAASSGSP